MRLLIAALTLALTAASAQAQLGTINNGMGPGASIGQNSAAAASHRNDKDEQKVKANEKAYNSALHNLPDKQYDPWHGVR